jgi:outer membrane protein
MKYFSLIVFSFIALSSFSQSVVIAHVQSDSIIPKMESYLYAMTELQAYSQNLQKQFEGKEAEMEAYYMDVMDKGKRGILSPKEQKDAETKLQEMQTKLQQSAQEMDAQLAEKEKTLMGPVQEEYNNAIKAVSKQNGYSFIIDKKLILYSDGGIDATEKLRAALKIK